MLIVAGGVRRRDRRTHVRLVCTGIASDLAPVLLLEFQRSVIVGSVTRDWTALQITHIVTSMLAVALYLPTIWLGAQILRREGGATTRLWHGRVAQAALGARTIGFLCMWSLRGAATQPVNRAGGLRAPPR